MTEDHQKFRSPWFFELIASPKNRAAYNEYIHGMGVLGNCVAPVYLRFFASRIEKFNTFVPVTTAAMSDSV